EFDDPGLNQRLQFYLDKYGGQLSANEAALKKDLREQIFLAVTLHEVGHNMGCRHNFRGSYDALNYFPDYWKLRTEGVKHADAGMKPSDGKLHPRYVAQAGGAESKYEANNSIREYQY